MITNLQIDSPSPPVQSSDTFEIQRQKINNLASALTNSSNFTSHARWVTFTAHTGVNGAVTPDTSSGIASVTKTANGCYTIVLSSAMTTATPGVIAQIWDPTIIYPPQALHIPTRSYIAIKETSSTTVQIETKYLTYRNEGHSNDRTITERPSVTYDIASKISIVIFGG